MKNVAGAAASDSAARIFSVGAGSPPASNVSATRRAISHHLQLVGRLVQSLGTGIGKRHDVLDPNAEATFEIDPGLDAEGHAHLERRAVAANEIRRLVSVETDPVTGAMEERLTVSGRGDGRARSGVDLLHGHPRANGLERNLVGPIDDLVDVPKFV